MGGKEAPPKRAWLSRHTDGDYCTAAQFATSLARMQMSPLFTRQPHCTLLCFVPGAAPRYHTQADERLMEVVFKLSRG